MESLVDLSYRGVSLGRRIKLTQVRPTTGYLETPAPMPVGTPIAIATDEGHTIEAIVTQVHEQTAGNEVPAGMRVTPALAGDVATWWLERSTPEPAAEAAPPPRPKQATSRPRSDTMIEATPSGAIAGTTAAPPPPPPVDPLMASLDAAAQTVAQNVEAANDGRTVMMAAVTDPDEPRSTGEHAVVDDGRATMAMDAIDISALGLDVSDSGGIPVADDEEPDLRSSSPNLPASGGTKKRKKRSR